jgi:hypothetical protein
MKTTIYALVLMVGLALSVPAQARDIHGGGIGSRMSAPMHSAAPHPHAMPGARLNGPGRLGTTAGTHIIAKQPASAHPNWNHNQDHWWHGHRCHFVNGSWVIFDLGFYDPFFWGYGWGYPYGGYPYDYYEGGDATGGSPIAAVQMRLANQGYYRGEIDGIMGPQTRRALMRYQRAHGLRETGYVSDSTLQQLGVR